MGLRARYSDYSDRRDIANTAFIKIARGRVVDQMGLPPKRIRGEGKHADEPPNPIIKGFVFKKSAVATIMLDNEQANKKC